MADKKISALTGASTPLAGTEVLPIVQGGATVKVAVSDLTAGRAVSALTLASTTGATFATTSGNVGIGTASPGEKFVVTSSTADTLLVEITNTKAAGQGDAYLKIGKAANGNSNGIQLYTGSTQKWIVGTGITAIDDNFKVYSPTYGERITVANSTGNVGINSSTPTALLQIGNEAESLPATYTGDIKLNSPLRTSLQGTGGIEFIVGGGGYCAKIQAISDNGASLSFGTRYGSASWTERVRIDSLGDVTNKTGNFVPATAAKGINFTANTPAAGMTSQLLNWYEEGTWTPSIGGNATYTTQTGRYTRVGRLVTFMGDITINVQGTGNAGSIVGLPFSAVGNNAVYVGYFSNLGQTVSSISPFVGGTTINLYGILVAAATATNLTILTSGARLMFQGSYEV